MLNVQYASCELPELPFLAEKETIAQLWCQSYRSDWKRYSPRTRDIKKDLDAVHSKIAGMSVEKKHITARSILLL